MFSSVMRLILAVFGVVVDGLENGVARTPPMGFISWQRFGAEITCVEFPKTCISEDLYLEIAKAMFDRGLTDAGYVYVNIDDNWSKRNSNSVADPVRFKSGMKTLSDKIKALGMKLGMYSDIGTETCQGYVALNMDNPGSRIAAIAFIDQLIDWRVEYLKVDGCHAVVHNFWKTYPKLSRMITHRLAERNGKLAKGEELYQPILLSCSWPAYQRDHGVNERDLALMIKYCNTWRNQGDITDSWSTVKSIVDWYASQSTNSDSLLVSAAGPGHWNDPDMLVIGNNGLSPEQEKTQFNIWAIMAAPLYISADVRTISDASLAILKNKKVIEINQDPLGRQGWVIHVVDRIIRVWMRPLTKDEQGHDRVAVLFESLADAFNKRKYTLDLKLIGWVGEGLSWTADDCYSVAEPQRGTGQTFAVFVDENTSQMYVFTRLDDVHVEYPKHEFGIGRNLARLPSTGSLTLN
jgi:alpha-N-acetylgalactosaminidase